MPNWKDWVVKILATLILLAGTGELSKMSRDVVKGKFMKAIERILP
jgi:hypothetical protein